jgi:multiple sugar transport system permease protein
MLMVTPAILLFGTFVAWPIASSLVRSQFDWDGVTLPSYVGLGNFRELLADEVFWKALKNNLIWISCVGIGPLLGLCLALLVSRRFAGARLIRTLFLLPFVLSQALVGTIFSLVFDADLGPFATAAPDLLGHADTAIFGIIAASLWPHSAYCMILYLAGLAAVDRDIVEAGKLDGAAGLSGLRYITVPLLRPTTLVVITVSLITALRSFDIPLIMTNGGPANSSTVLALYAFQQTFQGLRFGYGAAIASMQFALAMTGVLLLFTLQRRYSR